MNFYHLTLLRFSPGSRVWTRFPLYLVISFLLTITSYAQNGTTKIKGRVTDEAGKPVNGASVLVKGTKAGVSSDSSGYYTIVVTGTKNILTVSSVGFADREVLLLNGQTTVNVTLKATAGKMDEVVVIGYGSQRRADLTGSITGIKAEDIQKSKAISFMDALQGRLSGVQISSSGGEPGANVNINIRGANSFTSGTQPLYVIDGVQIDVNTGEAAGTAYGNTAQLNPLSGINPSDIESIEVLKDASATAIFGSRGANGVVIVTTKGGKANTSALEVNVFNGWSTRTKKLKMIGAQDFASYRYLTDPTSPTWAEDSNGDGILDRVKDVSKLPEFDWQDLLLRTANAQNYNIGYSGGNNKTTFASSLSYLKQQGLISKNDYQRFSLNLKLTHAATSNLKIGTTLNASHVINTGVASSGGDGPQGSNGIIQNLIMYKPVNVLDEGLSAADPEASGLSTPTDFVNYSYRQIPITRLLADVFVDYKIINGLSLNVHAGAIVTNSKSKEWYPNTTSWGFPVNGMAILSSSNTMNWYQTGTLNYAKRFSKVHYINALVGLESNTYIGESFAMRGTGFDIQSANGADNIVTAKVLAQLPATNKYQSDRISQFGRLNYNFKDKYLFTATIRRDGSSKFGTNNKYAWFPSGALAWKVTNEPFLKANKYISDLKIRTSFGMTGNDRIPAYQSLATTTNAFYSNVNNAADLGIAPNSAPNPNLKWETTYQYDAGLELGLLDNRISITSDVYLKQTRDLLMQADVGSQGGFIRQWQNIGRVDNKGIELAINTVNIKKKDFSWSTNFNITLNRNKVKSLGSVGFIPVTVPGSFISTFGRLIVGQPIGTGYGYQFDGIYQLDDFNKQPNGSYVLKPGVVSMGSRAVQPGDMKFRDLDGDGVVNVTKDYGIISNSNPKHYGGFSNSVTWRQFDLSVLFQWNYGNQILNATRYRYEAGNGYVFNLTQDYWDNRWTNTNPSQQYASITGRGKIDPSSYYTEDGSYLRLKNITIGYNFSPRVLQRLKLSQVRIYATAENVITWTKYSGYDPELVSSTPLLPGLDNLSYPRSRTITLGIGIKL